MARITVIVVDGRSIERRKDGRVGEVKGRRRGRMRRKTALKKQEKVFPVHQREERGDATSFNTEKPLPSSPAV